ncbi:PAS domain-containing protein [Pacificispira sp.]|uniref:PAS domain-containing protein n=1 Tax=Pacificispira sp. TaxID=2888761 RepID=UPI003BAD2ABA
MTSQSTARKQNLSELPDPNIRIVQLLDAWKAARGGQLVPSKRDFDPLSVPRLLSSIWLYRWEPDKSGFVCRLAGEDVNRSWGYSIAGHDARQVLGDKDFEVVTDIWRKILTTPLIHYGKGERLHENRMYSAERLVLPLIGEDSPDGEPDHVLGLSLYELGETGETRPQIILQNAYQVHCADIV